jgi:N,N'-diacetylchitobiose transport system substrate-binding protein
MRAASIPLEMRMSEISRRSLLALGGAVGAGVLLAGCSASPAATTSSGPAKLRIWFMKDSVSDKAMSWLKDTFEKQNPGSTISYEIQVWDGIVSKLQTALASSDSTPDIVELGNTQAPTFCAVNALKDLTSLKSTLGGSDLAQSLVDLGSFGGKMYAAPFYAGSRIYIYRKDMFDEAGVTVPQTVDELVDVAAKLQSHFAPKVPNYSAVFLAGNAAQQSFAWLFTDGGRLATQSGSMWKGGLSSAKAQKSFQQLQKLWSTGSTTGKITDSDTAANLWVPLNAGQAAMAFGFNFHVKSIDPALLSAGKIGYFGFPPAEQGGTSHAFAGGSNVAISAKTQNPDKAEAALKLIFSKQFQEFFATEGGWVPGNVKYGAALGDDDLSKLTVASVKTSVGTPAAKNWALVEAAKTVDDFYVALGAGGDPVSLAKQADSDMEAILNKS